MTLGFSLLTAPGKRGDLDQKIPPSFYFLQVQPLVGSVPSGRLLKLSEPLDWCNSSFPAAVTGGPVFSPPGHRIGTKQDSGRWEGGLGLQAFLEYLLALGPAAGGGAGGPRKSCSLSSIGGDRARCVTAGGDLALREVGAPGGRRGLGAKSLSRWLSFMWLVPYHRRTKRFRAGLWVVGKVRAGKVRAAQCSLGGR